MRVSFPMNDCKCVFSLINDRTNSKCILLINLSQNTA